MNFPVTGIFLFKIRQPLIDAATIYQAINAALTERLDMGILREVIETTIGQALAELALPQVSETKDEAASI